MLNVSIHLKETSQSISHQAVNTYTKGPFFCVFDGERVFKYPVNNIWRVVEDYGKKETSK
jgi:hypothetical protein